MRLALEIIGGLCLGVWALMVLFIVGCLLAGYERRLRRRIKRVWRALREPDAGDGKHDGLYRTLNRILPPASRRIH